MWHQLRIAGARHKEWSSDSIDQHDVLATLVYDRGLLLAHRGGCQASEGCVEIT